MKLFSCHRWIVVALLLLHAAMVAWIGWRTSITVDEVGHLPAGIYVWQFGRYDVYRVNPPLVRAVAAMPVVAARPELSWNAYRDGPAARPEWSLGREFVQANDGGEGQWFWYFALARWACIPLTMVGGYICYRWARDLYGPHSGNTYYLS